MDALTQNALRGHIYATNSTTADVTPVGVMRLTVMDCLLVCIFLKTITLYFKLYSCFE